MCSTRLAQMGVICDTAILEHVECEVQRLSDDTAREMCEGPAPYRGDAWESATATRPKAMTNGAAVSLVIVAATATGSSCGETRSE